MSIASRWLDQVASRLLLLHTTAGAAVRFAAVEAAVEAAAALLEVADCAADWPQAASTNAAQAAAAVTVVVVREERERGFMEWVSSGGSVAMFPAVAPGTGHHLL